MQLPRNYFEFRIFGTKLKCHRTLTGRKTPRGIMFFDNYRFPLCVDGRPDTPWKSKRDFLKDIFRSGIKMSGRFSLIFRLRRARLLTYPRKGTTAVEMALIAPVFFLFLIGGTEMSLVLLTQHLMENAAYNTSRLAA